MSRTLWIDVTMLVNWSGKMTGIQRVEYNLASRFAKKNYVKFFVFDKTQNKLIDFDFKHIEYKINSAQNEPTVSVTEAVEVAPVVGIRGKVPKSAIKLLKPLYKAVRSGARQIKHGLSINAVKKADIKNGDDVLILSGDWSDDAFISLIAKKKQDGGLNVIQVIYDMLPSVYPAYFIEGMPKQFSDYMKKALKVSDQVLAISESTKKDINLFIKKNSLPKVQIDVFRLGDDFVLNDPEMPHSAKNQLKNKFLLTVGTVEARKNHQLILDAYIEAEKSNMDLPVMVVAGKKGWLVESFMKNIQDNPSVEKKIIFLQPTDTELAWLYKKCAFTVFPSIYEGWGLPVAESLFNGKLCLSSNSSSMPEIAGDMIDYFAPDNSSELLSKMNFYLNNDKKLKEKEHTIKGYKPTSWEDSFNEVCSLIKKR